MTEKEYIIEELIPKFLKLVSSEYDVNRLILYGSYAKGYANSMSDIDVAVVLNGRNDGGRFAITKNLYKIAQNIDLRFEPRCFFIDEIESAESASILAEILKTGIVVN